MAGSLRWLWLGQPRRSRRVGRRELGRAVHPAPAARPSSGGARRIADRAQHPHRPAPVRRRARGGCRVGGRVRNSQRGDGQPPAVVRRPGPCCVAGSTGPRVPARSAPTLPVAHSPRRGHGAQPHRLLVGRPAQQPGPVPGSHGSGRARLPDTRRSSASPRGRWWSWSRPPPGAATPTARRRPYELLTPKDQRERHRLGAWSRSPKSRTPEPGGRRRERATQRRSSGSAGLGYASSSPAHICSTANGCDERAVVWTLATTSGRPTRCSPTWAPRRSPNELAMSCSPPVRT